MASNSEYEQRRCFKVELTPFLKMMQDEVVSILKERERQKSLPIKVFHSNYVLNPLFENKFKNQ